MRPQLLGSAVLIFFFGTIFSVISSGRWILNGEMNIINTLASFNAATFSSGGGYEAVKGVPGFFDAIVTALSWNYPYLSDAATGGWGIFVKMPLWVVSIMVIWAFIEVFLNVIQGLVGTVRSLIPGL